MVLVFVKIVLWERLRCEVLERLRSGEYYTFRVCFWPKYMHVWVGAFETAIQITRKRNNHFVHFSAVSTPILRLLPPPHQFIHHKHPRVSSAYARVIVYIPPHQQYSDTSTRRYRVTLVFHFTQSASVTAGFIKVIAIRNINFWIFLDIQKILYLKALFLYPN